jgi:long-chain acyl-CoA synthetase
VGDRRPYVVALVTLDREQVEKVARTEHEIRALVQQAVDGVNRDLGRSEHVRRFAILPRELEQEQAELTPTLKVRRRVCEEHFRAEIDRLYAGA